MNVLTTEIFGAQVLVSMTDYSGDVGDLTGVGSVVGFANVAQVQPGHHQGHQREMSFQ